MATGGAGAATLGLRLQGSSATGRLLLEFLDRNATVRTVDRTTLSVISGGEARHRVGDVIRYVSNVSAFPGNSLYGSYGDHPNGGGVGNMLAALAGQPGAQGTNGVLPSVGGAQIDPRILAQLQRGMSGGAYG